MFYLAIAIPGVLLLALRVTLHLLTPISIGADHWFWKIYVENYHNQRKFPPKLPQYRLEKNQWYPPLFPLLISLFSEPFFERWNFSIALIIDLSRLLFLLFVVSWLSDGSLWATSVAGILYVTSPILIFYNLQLNPRGLAALFLDMLIVVLLWKSVEGGSVWLWVIAVFLAGLILLTHKMTTQLLWFLCLGVGFAIDVRYWFLFPASLISAMILSRGFYWKVLRAHWDIVRFWNRNWSWLQVDPIKESPIYGEEGYESPNRFYKNGLKGFFRHLRYLVGYAPSVWWLIILFGVQGISLVSDEYASLRLVWWWTIIFFFSLSTVFMPFLRCIGSGYYYLYNGVFPASILWGLLVDSGMGWNMVTLFTLTALIANLIGLGLIYYKKTARQSSGNDDEGLEQVLMYLNKAPKGVVMCLPPQWYDLVAYKTGQPVLYGGHGYGFDLLEPTFPRIMLSVPELIQRYELRYLLTRRDYLPPKFMADMPDSDVKEFGTYLVYPLK